MDPQVRQLLRGDAFVWRGGLGWFCVWIGGKAMGAVGVDSWLQPLCLFVSQGGRRLGILQLHKVQMFLLSEALLPKRQ